jgi:hypothetical protein
MKKNETIKSFFVADACNIASGIVRTTIMSIILNFNFLNLPRAISNKMKAIPIKKINCIKFKNKSDFVNNLIFKKIIDDNG